MNKIVQYIPLAALALALTASCDYDDAVVVKAEELGLSKTTIKVSSDEGALGVAVYSNMNGTVSIADNSDWLTISPASFKKDDSLHVSYQANTGFPRMAKIAVVTDTRTDTLRIKQEGLIEPELKFMTSSVIAYNSKGETKAQVNTNLEPGEITMKTSYTEGQEGDWISGYVIENGFLVLTTSDNSGTSLRNAKVTLSYLNGWEEVISTTLYVTQANVHNEMGNEVSFNDVRLLADVEGYNINTDIYITGYVVSNKTLGNAGDNTRLTSTSIDYTISKKTAYIESLDGQYGFSVETDSEDDNIFQQYSKVQILLKGTKVTMINLPERYTIKGVTSAMVMTAVSGTKSDLPVKEKYMSELTDKDVYTYVTLKDCEIPLRKGSLSPMNEGYANAGGGNRASKYPTLIRDVNGSSMYMYTNTTCLYRRDGSRLPNGSGKISGVIVHETHRSFIDNDSPVEDECGNIGKYQIRHTTKEDIALEDSLSDNFSGLITEFRYVDHNGDGWWNSTYGKNGQMIHTYPGYTTSKGDRCYGTTSFSYLGPVGNNVNYIFGNNRGNVNGMGIILEDGTDYLRTYNKDINADGKGSVTGNSYCAWGNSYWWDEEKDRPYCWLVKFSTKGYSTDKLSMQISVQNVSQKGRVPRYWAAQWSTTGDTEATGDADWKDIGTYTIPDVVVWSNTLMFQSNAYKTIDFPLPLDMLDKDVVYIRLIPTSKKASDGYSYDGGTAVSANGSALEYFAVRYNK